MRIRATLKLRNETMLKQREKLWLTQAALAELASVPLSFVLKLERLDFSPCFEFEQKLIRIAGVLELKPEKIVPPEILGEKFTSRFVSIKDCDIRAFAAPDAVPAVIATELKDTVNNALATLDHFSKKVVEMRYGLNGNCTLTLEEIGRKTLKTQENVRQTEIKALGSLVPILDEERAASAEFTSSRKDLYVNKPRRHRSFISYIPRLTDEEIRKRADKILPIIRYDGKPYYINPVCPFSVSYLWNPKPSSPAKVLIKKLDITTYHAYGYHGLFKPSIAEILAQIPERLLPDVIAFEIIESPKFAGDLHGHPLKAQPAHAFIDGYHVAITRLYGTIASAYPSVGVSSK